MPLSKTEALITQFYDWEIRGRGWMVAPVAVDLEPPFHPFFGHYVPEPYIDDGKRPTLFSSIASLFQKKTEPIGYSYRSPSYELFPYEDDIDITAYRIVFARHYKIRIEILEQLYIICSHCNYPLSFELVATYKDISTYLVCRTTDKAFVFSQLNAFFPEASIVEDSEIIEGIINADKEFLMVDYGLEEEFMRPILQVQNLDNDPYTSFFGVLEQMKFGQRVVVQILFSGTQNNWSESIMKSVTDGYKGSFFIDAPEMPQLAQEKISRPLFGVAMRLIVQGETNAPMLLQSANTCLLNSTLSRHNRLIALHNEEDDLEQRYGDIRFRESHRFGMLLNSRELATLAHFPNPSITSSKLVRVAKRTKALPSSVIGHSYVLGANVHHGIEQLATLNVEQRSNHIHIIGATGTRKSSLFLHLINQDIQAGAGVAVLDPHGDLIENILPYIPKERIKDVVIIDPNDREFPVSFNILTAHSEIEKDVLSSDLVALFKRFSTSWGDQMNSVFANAMIAFLDNTKTGTLLDLRRFLIEREFREHILLTVTDPDIVYYWRKEFPLLKGGSIAPILTRLDTFLRPKLIRNMVSQKKSLNFQELMDGKKIILVKLSEGMIGEENSFLLGAFIVSKIQQSAMARQAVEKDTRTPFYLYMDEFHHFITPSMASMLTGVRKYGLGLILAHQNIAQVAKYDAELVDALANAGTRVCFRVGDTDAKRLSDGFTSFETIDLQNLSAGEAIARVGKSEDDFSLFASSLRPSDERGFREEIIAHSRSHYSSKIEMQIEEPPHPPVYTAPSEPKSPPPPPPEQDEEKLKLLSTPRQQTTHRHHQVLIKKMAEAHGYKANLEVLTPDGKGKVDVLLERNGKTIAVEVSDTTEAAWELHNIVKCVTAGYTHIYCCIAEPATRRATQALANALSPPPTNLTIDTTEALLALLQTPTQPEQTEIRIKGYRVKMHHTELTVDVANTKRAIIETIMKSGWKKSKE